jgi:hypothetical protein
MATPAQIAANRTNAQKSTGPRTDEGKLRASQNALRHGLCAGAPLMNDEKDEEVQELLTALREEHQPAGPTEEILVYKIAEHFFYGIRAAYLLSEQLDSNDGGDDNAREIGLMMRYHAASDRGYYRALTELRKIQKDRRLQEIGSVSSTPGAARCSDLSLDREQPDATTDPSTAPQEIGFVSSNPRAPECTDLSFQAATCNGKISVNAPAPQTLVSVTSQREDNLAKYPSMSPKKAA